MILSDSALRAYDRVASGIGRVIGLIAEKGADQIRKQVASGRDRRGNKMVGYKPKYAERKGSNRVDLRSNSRVSHGRNKKPMMDDIVFDAPAYDTFSTGRGAFRDESTGRFAKASASISFGSPENSRIAGAIIAGRAGRGPMAGPRDFFGLDDDWVKSNVDKEFRSMFTEASAGIRNQRLNIRAL